MSRVVTISDSSQIKMVSYDHSSRTMQVRFSNGNIYIYQNVTAQTFGALISAESVGKYFDQNVRPFYKGAKISE